MFRSETQEFEEKNIKIKSRENKQEKDGRLKTQHINNNFKCNLSKNVLNLNSKVRRVCLKKNLHGLSMCCLQKIHFVYNKKNKLVIKDGNHKYYQ